MEIDQDRAHQVLSALGNQLEAAGERFELVVIGGSALLALGLIERATRDVDLVALMEDGDLVAPTPLPEALITARDRVAQDFGLDADWLNAAPSSLLDFGLYALVDQGPGKHEADLRALTPSREELLRAARWSTTHDPSDGFRQQLLVVLEYLGVEDADLEA